MIKIMSLVEHEHELTSVRLVSEGIMKASPRKYKSFLQGFQGTQRMDLDKVGYQQKGRQRSL